MFRRPLKWITKLEHRQAGLEDLQINHTAHPTTTEGPSTTNNSTAGTQTDPVPPTTSARELAEIERRLTSKEEELRAIKSETTTMDIALRESKSDIEKLQDENRTLIQKVEQYKAHVSKTFAATNTLRLEKSTLATTCDRLRLERQKLREKAEEVKKEIAELVADRDRIGDDRQHLKNINRVLARDFNLITSDRQRARDQVKQLEVRNEQQSQELNDLGEKLKKATAAGSTLDTMRIELSSLQTSRLNLIEQLSRQQTEGETKQRALEEEVKCQQTLATDYRKQLTTLEDDLKTRTTSWKLKSTEMEKEISLLKANQRNLIESLSTQKDEYVKELQDSKIQITQLSQSLAAKTNVLAAYDGQLQKHQGSTTHPAHPMSPDTMAESVTDTVLPIELPKDALKEWATHGKMFMTGRVRPMSETEQSNHAVHCIADDPGNANIIFLRDPALREVVRMPQPRQQGLAYKFDQVFWSQHDNLDIFKAFSYLAAGFLDGFNVGIISDGPSGSGKTHTMLKGERALVPTAIHSIIGHKALQGRVLYVRAIEVYKEHLRDVSTLR